MGGEERGGKGGRQGGREGGIKEERGREWRWSNEGRRMEGLGC